MAQQRSENVSETRRSVLCQLRVNSIHVRAQGAGREREAPVASISRPRCLEFFTLASRYYWTSAWASRGTNPTTVDDVDISPTYLLDVKRVEQERNKTGYARATRRCWNEFEVFRSTRAVAAALSSSAFRSFSIRQERPRWTIVYQDRRHNAVLRFTTGRTAGMGWAVGIPTGGV